MTADIRTCICKHTLYCSDLGNSTVAITTVNKERPHFVKTFLIGLHSYMGVSVLFSEQVLQGHYSHESLLSL